MATVLKTQREKMTKAELDKDIALQQQRMEKNKEAMKNAPSYLKEAANELGSMGNKRLQESKAEAVQVRQTNSRAQYEHEKAQGDPNALKMSFEDWKKL